MKTLYESILADIETNIAKGDRDIAVMQINDFIEKCIDRRNI